MAKNDNNKTIRKKSYEEMAENWDPLRSQREHIRKEAAIDRKIFLISLFGLVIIVVYAILRNWPSQ